MFDQVIIAQWLAGRVATDEVPGSNSSKGVISLIILLLVAKFQGYIILMVVFRGEGLFRGF